MAPTGFLAAVDDRRHGRFESSTRVDGRGEAAILGHGFALYARPLLSTPEAAAETQPLAADDLFLVYAGRIDNREAIAGELRACGRTAATDGQLLALAYRHWGQPFPSRLTGEFSFAILDRINGRLVCGRDALGIRKLYVHRARAATVIASSLDLLLPALERRPAVDRAALPAYFASGGLWNSTDRTIYDGVRSCPPGQLIVIDPSGALSSHVHWTADSIGELGCRSVDEYDERFRTLFFDVVGQALRARGTVAVELSGGLDSSSVASVAASVASRGGSGRAIVAYSVVDSGDSGSDDIAFQRAVASRYSLPHFTFEIADLDDDVNPQAAAQPGMIMAQAWMLDAQRRLAKAVAPAVCLTGHGGDAVLCAGPHRMFQWTAIDAWQTWRRRHQLDLGGRDMRRRISDWLTPDFQRDVRDAVRSAAAGLPPLGRAAGRNHHLRLIANLAASVPDDSRLPWEPRYPLLNKHLVEFMVALPWDQKITRDESRIIQRRALAAVVPDMIRGRRTKANFTKRLIRSLSAGSQWERLSRGTNLEALGVVRQPAFGFACQRLRRGLITDEVGFYVAALTLEAWLLAARASADVSESRHQRILGDPLGRLVDRGVSQLDPGVRRERIGPHPDAQVSLEMMHSQ